MALKYAILGILAGGSKNGSAVRRELNQLLAGIWTVNQGQVFATLERLARDRLATVEERRAAAAPGRRTFAVSAAGRRALGRWLERPSGAAPPCSLLPARLALHAWADDTASIVRLLGEQRARCDALARLLPRPRGDRTSTGRDLVAETALRHVAAELQWLALVERELVAETALLD